MADQMSDNVGDSFACYFPSVRAGNPAAVSKRRMASRVSLDHVQEILTISEDQQKAVFGLLQTAWALVLHYYTSLDEVCFGCDELDIGGSAAEMPEQRIVRLVIEDTMTLHEVLQQIQGKFSNPQEHESFGSVERSRPLLYNTAVTFRVRSSPNAPDATFPKSQTSIGLPQECKVRILVKYLNGSLSVFLEWWHPDISTLFASSIAEVYGHMVSYIFRKPGSAVEDLKFITERDREQILEWNAGVPETVGRCIHKVIEDQVHLRPDSEAVCAWDGSLTFLELDHVASKLAVYLVELGVRPETRVSLCFKKSKWNIIAMLAVLKAGGAFVPLDLSHPIPRLQALIRAVDSSILLCASANTSQLALVAQTIIALDDGVIDSLATKMDENSLSCLESTNAAYVLFTSGSTGEPKATVIDHQAYCSSANAHASPLLFDSGSRVLQFAAHTFDASLVEMLTSLMYGACICIPSEDARLNNIAGAIRDMRVNHAILTPSFVRFLDPSTVPGLNRLVLAGEALSQANVDTWSEIELANGYGPTESSVAAVVNSRISKATDCQDIGLPVGVRCWIIDPGDHDRLVPVGCTGELLLEGPTLARCYLNNPEKTAESFIYDPAWTIDKNPRSNRRRFYKTGDLVRYNSDSGSLSFVGRKDTQVKFHGQRIELGEIESHLAADQDIKHGLIILPKLGRLAQKLVAIITLSDKLLDQSSAPKNDLRLLNQQSHRTHVSDMRERIASLLPGYMIPSVWLCVESLPVLASCKLDRKAVQRWIETINGDSLLQTAPGGDIAAGEMEEAVSDTESELRDIWSRVLNIPFGRTSLNHSFLSLGGDSITAMTCMNQCKAKGIGLTVQEVLRSKSIKELATCAKRVSNRNDYQEDLDIPFDLSPIQNLHFSVRNNEQGHFNQSFFLRVNREISEDDLRHAIQIIVSRHSMLRARFDRNLTERKWQQRITSYSEKSYQFKAHKLSTIDEVKMAISDSQISLNAVHGPVVALDLFHVEGDGQLLSMIGHHLVIDLVSWRVVLEDLEELLLHSHTPALLGETLPFQSWCRLQAEHCFNHPLKSFHHSDDVPGCDPAYWGMQNCPNVYGDVVCHGFELSPAATSRLLTESNHPFRTDPVDILLAALLYSFGNTFTDRSVPVVHNEGHGREAWDTSIDISRTVGWFTIIYPVFVQRKALNNIVDTLIQVKDLRRRVTDNGRAYFARSILTGENTESYRNIEIAFNFLGRYQQLERKDALFQPVEGLAGETAQGGGAADVGRETPRFGLFEISAVVVQDTLRFAFSFNGTMKHQDRIRQWISSCQDILSDLSKNLTSMQCRPTISDFSLLNLTYEDISGLTEKVLLQAGIRTMEEVEDIYPCSPMQQGLILSRTRDASFYAVHVTYEIKETRGQQVDIERLAHSWQRVVARHAMLRTLFAENLATNHLYCQIVLKNYKPSPLIVRCLNEEDVLSTLNTQLMVSSDRKPAHEFTICSTQAGKVFCRLEISHTIMDGTSISIILRDLERAYSGNLSHGGRPLFSHFISYLQMQPQDASIGYWRSYLSGMDPCHIPILNDGFKAERQYRTLRLAFQGLARLQSLCEAYGFTVANVFHGAWAMTLRCYTGSDDVCFGYLLSERDIPVDTVGDAVGPMINMLVCRVNMPLDIPVSVFLDHIQEDYMNSLPFKHVSLADVQHALGLSGTALFNTCFSYRKLPPAEPQSQSAIEFLECAGLHDPTEYLVTVNVEASNEDAVIDLDYWTDSLSNGQAANIASTFLMVLENIIDHPMELLGRLDYMSGEHLQQIAEWNSSMPSIIDRCIHDVFADQAKLRPGSPAICSWDGNFTYAQVETLSSRLACYLFSLGIVPETFVALCFDKSAYTIISMLAVLKAGGCCVPLDVRHPKAALDLRITETGAQIVLSSPSRAYLLEDIAPYVISVNDSFLNQLSANDELICTVRPSNTAFVIFTSGSTGKPKGVLLEHRSLVTSAEAHGVALGVSPSTRFLQFASYSFDNSLEEMFTTLMRGGCVCVPSEHDRMNNLARAMNEMDVNFTDLTSTVAAFLQPSDVPKLRGLAIGGEAPTKEIRDTWATILDLQNIYGPTECSINCTHNPNIGDSGDITNIGRSIGSLSWIVDPENHDKLVPVGCVGELLVEGPIVARGYLNNPEKTQQSFVEDPGFTSKFRINNVSRETGTAKRRMYKTGDLVRYNCDGSLVYLGRKDTQVKLNGQRIELGEIEHRIKTVLPSESQCSVDLVISGNRKKALVAFLCLPAESVVSDGDSTIMAISKPFQSVAMMLKSSLASSSPAHFVPNLYMPVSSMPLTSSGKLNRRMLRTLAESILKDDPAAYRLGGQTGRAPSTSSERILQSLWASVLGVDAGTISAEDTFFRHGGDSVAAMRLVTAARQEGYSLSVADIFQAPRLFEMAQNISGISAATLEVLNAPVEPFSLLGSDIAILELKSEAASVCGISANAIEDIYPCTALQEGLIALSSQQPGSYVTQNIYTLPPDIDIQKFRDAWQKVSHYETILRTRIIHSKTHGFFQVIIQEPLMWDSAIDVTFIPETHRHLPPTPGGILSRYTIVSNGINSPYFVWTAHHAIYDGWSLPTLLSRVKSCYEDANQYSNETRCYYPQFIKYLTSIDIEQSNAFWKQKLENVTAARFPPSLGTSHKPAPTSQLNQTLRLPPSSSLEVTMPSIVRAAWALIVSVYTFSDDVVFGEILTGRDAPLPGISDLIGATLATIPMRIRINPDLKIAQFLREVQGQAASVIPHQHSGLQNIMRLSPDAKSACDFQTLFAIANDMDEPADEFLNLSSANSGVSNFFTHALNLSCTISSNRLVVQAHYDEKVLPTCQLTRLLYQLETLIANLCSEDNGEVTVGQMGLVGVDDLATLHGWNAQPLKAINRCIHDMVDENTRLKPDAIAIRSWDATLTYRELSEQSASLACRIQELTNYIPDAFIPVCFEKSAFAAVSMLAIMKAGYAFVPLDPQHPRSRLREIITDLDAKIILCSPRHVLLCKEIVGYALVIDSQVLKDLPIKQPSLQLCCTNGAAYAIFTSGSTGRPKGCIVEHSAFCSGASKHGPAFSISPGLRMLQFASYTFDASVLEILTTLLVGGCVCVPNETARLNTIAEYINDMKIDTALLTPSMAQIIRPDDVPCLRNLVLVGEAMSPNHISTWAGRVNLVNGYGPTECAVVAAAKSHMTLDTSPANIGTAIDTPWIVDPSNHNRLVPVGAIGELLIEGPTLARGYLNNEQKTSEVFITNPSWSIDKLNPLPASGRRMYKTGDLVKYAPDNSGDLLYIGRKDSQAKLHGQRLELEEVEHHLNADNEVLNAFVTVPKTGKCLKKLVAVVSLRYLSKSTPDICEIEIVTSKDAPEHLPSIQERLKDHLPAYMIPSIWIIVEDLPLLASGKLNRRKVENYIETIDDGIYQQIMTIQQRGSLSIGLVMTETEARLRTIWGNVLKMPPESIGLDRSFLHLGGDSMSAMAVMSRCRAENIGITVENIITSESIRHLASVATLPQRVLQEQEDDQEFDLSPIQQLYFRCMQGSRTHFNQSMLLRIRYPVSTDFIREAICQLVKTHSMLRARFSRDANGVWKQRITNDTEESYLLHIHKIDGSEDMERMIKDIQQNLDIVDGPLLGAGLFETPSGESQLFLSVHHLVIDVVSWSIILEDLESCFHNSRPGRPGTSFQNWCRLQSANAKRKKSVELLPNTDIPLADFGYWGMEGSPNHHGDVINEDIELEVTTTSELLKICHESLHIELVDMLLANLLMSFCRVFSDRALPPAIFNEGHGREPWDSSTDLSRTVGWFTTLSPVHLPQGHNLDKDSDLLKCITWVKDFRRKTPGKGMPYFAHRLLTWEGNEKFGRHWPMEIAFNYLGQHNNFDPAKRLLEPINRTGQSVNSQYDIGADVPRFSLIEISAAVIENRLKLSFAYNKSMKKQTHIQRWTADCRDVLCEAVINLRKKEPERSLSDFRLIPLSFNGLDKLKEILLAHGVASLNEVEDVYPCSPMQQGILLSQLKNPATYSYKSIFEIQSSQINHLLDLERLVNAWQFVVQRHSTLRTIFIDGIHESSLLDQVVLKSTQGRTVTYECEDDGARVLLSGIKDLNYRDGKPPHRLVLCKTRSGKVYCRFEITNAISDGSSIPILLRDLSRAYLDISHGSEHPLYSNFIAYLQSISNQKGTRYWKDYLAGAEPCQFPSLLNVRDCKKRLGSHILALERVRDIHQFCMSVGVTSSALLQLVWGLVLRSYTGSNEVCFGYISSGRDVPVKDIHDAVGAFINMLIYRIDLKDDLLLYEALKRTQLDFVRSMEHQSVSLAEVQHELGLSEISLFNTVFTFQRREQIEENESPTLSFKSFESHDPSEYKLAINVEMTDLALEVHFSYWMDHLSEQQVAYISDTFECVVYELLKNGGSGMRVGDIDFFGATSSLKVREWNSQPTGKIDRCIHDMIEEQCLNRPLSSPAIEGWDGSFTHTDLNTITGRLACRLVEYGVGPEVYVPLCFEKSSWAIVAQIAVLKAGGAFVPLDPSHPDDRLRNLINDVGAHVVLSSAQQNDRLSRLSEMAITVDRHMVQELPPNIVIKPAVVNPSNAAYVIFTSGSTGKPKGTIIEHAAFCTSALAHGKAFHMNLETRTFQFASYTFDACIMEIFTTLIVGGCVCVPSAEERINNISGAITKMHANWMFSTPSVANTIKPESVPTLKVLVLGGEKLTQGSIERWAKSVCLLGGYGPTECSAICAMSEKFGLNGEVLDENPATIGKAVGSRLWIVDPRAVDRLVPIGAIGELLIEGDIVGRGYLNNEKKTREVFIRNPQWSKHDNLRGIIEHDRRMYRTGDLVRYNVDGTISYVARMDMQIKLNGQRIEIGEIEYQCGRHFPEHTQLAVDLLTVGPKSSVKKLAMFFTVQVSNTSGKRDHNAESDRLLLQMSVQFQGMVRRLEKSVSGILPSYMIPQLFFPVSHLPCTTSGKLDRRKLQKEVQNLTRDILKAYSLSNSVKRQGPRDKMEHALMNLWEQALGIPSNSIGIEDSFFRVGGDSLAAMRLVGLARSRGISLGVVDIFRSPILKDMARTCGSLQENDQHYLRPFCLLKGTESTDKIIDEVSSQCRIEKQLILDIYPCSPLQEGLITLSIKQPGAYVAQNVLRLSERVDIPNFKAAWQQLVDEFDILRTRIVHTASSNFLQVVLKEQPIKWHIIDSLDQVAEETITLPEYEGGPLTRFTIIQAKGFDTVSHFVWSIHHAIYDGWGLSIILKRIEDIYFGRSSERVTASYAAFIDYLQRQDTHASDKFWTSYLSEMSPVSFPQGASQPSNQRSHPKTLCGTTEICQSVFNLNITVPTLIRAAWAIILSNCTQSGDVCFGETLTGRNVDVSGITDIAGPILTTVPTRIRINPEIKINDFLAEVHRIATEMIPHQHSGLQHIRRLGRDASLACDFQNLLIVQKAESDTNSGLWVAENDGKMGNFFTYPLVVECKVSDLQVVTNFHYVEGVISSWQVARLLRRFSFVLQQLSDITEASHKQLGKIDMLSPEDKEEISWWNRRQPQCVDQSIHGIFKERCIAQPSAPAVCAWDGELTYSKLDEYASRLAIYLETLGVGQEVFVPLCVDKSVWTIVAMMGVLIAGGAVVPLDPSHPSSRHQEILKELDANVVLCSPKYSRRYSNVVRNTVGIDTDMMETLQTSGKYMQVGSAKGSNAAYAIFTSGSTGRAKGIIVEHQAFVSSSIAFGPAMHMESTSRVLQFASLSFDAALMEIFSTLMNGGCICVPSEDERLKDLSGAIHQMNVSWTLLTPSVANLIDPSTVPSLKVLVCGGEAMSPETIARWSGKVELINAYGPSEASVVATVNADVSSQKPSCIGYGTSPTLTWVVDPDDHDKLCPLGTIGELALEGPTLARGYLNDKNKTTAAFVEDPAWVQLFPSLASTPRRIHKTGDLVKYNPEGSLEYVGRKDNQVKLHGQRMDLGEIEHRLETDPRVRHVVVLMPKFGLLQGRLISVLSLNSLSMKHTALAARSCDLVSRDSRVDSELAEIQQVLSTQLPSYMLPQAWAVVKMLPMLVSGKLDRKTVKDWIEGITEDTYQHIVGTAENDELSTQVTGVAALLQEIWAQVLNTPLERVNLNQSFLSLGGDSITAMAVVSRSRRQKMKLSLHDVLRCTSIHHLARTVEASIVSIQHEERVNEPFGLAPIQQLYFQAAKTYHGRARFNQSFTLRLSRHISTDSIKSAIRAITSQHSMLRARFDINTDGQWEQRFISDIDSSYHYQLHHIDSTNEIPHLISRSQEGLDIRNGPIFAAELYETSKKEQFLFLVSHHLSVDMVSWRIIIQDLQEFLENGSFSCDKPLSFQAWCALQEERIKSDANGGNLPFQVIPANVGYWGMEGLSNSYGDVEQDTFVLDEGMTASTMTGCHDIFRTEPVDLLISAIIHSFRRIFNDRFLPTLYNEAHGREPWDTETDLSRTVGWFTDICPLQLALDSDDVLDTLRRTKDVRRSLPQKGRQYLARRFLAPTGRSQFPGSDIPMEILFNYLGSMQQLERDDSLLQNVDMISENADSLVVGDMGPDTTRLALFEVSAVVIQGRLQFSFMFNRRMHRIDDIRRWISECKWTLEELVVRLRRCASEPTLSDYPLLPINYNGLQRLLKETFPRAGIVHRDQVEDIYPCTPTQEGMLLSQLRDPKTYFFHAIFEIKKTDSDGEIDLQRLSNGWQKVVDRHAALRTIFVSSAYKGGAFDQVVLKDVESGIIHVECDDSEALDRLQSIKLHDNNGKKKQPLPHQMTVCTTFTGRTLIKVEINHAVIDGSSTPILLRDLSIAYDGQLPEGHRPLYSDYVKYVRSQTPNADITFWKQYLADIRPCELPHLNKKSSSDRRLASLKMAFDQWAQVQQYCEKADVTIANVVQAAWALVLRKYTRSDDVCFGYLSAGRDAPVNGIQDTIGVFINMLCCRVRFTPSQILAEIPGKIQDDYLNGIPHQRCSLAQVQHELGLQGKQLFDTALSIQNHSRAADSDDASLRFVAHAAHDPSEYAITLNIETARDDEAIVFRYWTDLFSDDQASTISSVLASVLTALVYDPTEAVSRLDTETSNATDRQYVTGTHVSTQEQDEIQQLLEKHPGLQKLIDERVAMIVKQMFNMQGSPCSGRELTSKVADRNLTDNIQGQCSESDSSSNASEESYKQELEDNDGVLAPQVEERGQRATPEQRLLHLWSDKLGIPSDSITKNDSFFELGGDSIAAMGLVGEAHDEGLILTVADVFRNPVFEDMAAVVRLASGISGYVMHSEISGFNAQPLAAVARSDLYERFALLKAANIDDAFLQKYICPRIGVFKGGIADILPVTDFQALSITGALLDSRWMLNYFYLDGSGSLDVRRLKQSCSRVVHAFDILRTVFISSKGRFLQVILRKARPEFSVYETDDDLDKFTVMLQQRDRERGPRQGEPFVQFIVVKEKNTYRHRILIRLSHAQYDGVCLPRILSAIKAGYEGGPIPSTPSFANYVRESSRTVTTEHYDHWRDLLNGSHMTEIVRRQGPSYRKSTGDIPRILRKSVQIPSMAHGNLTTATIIKAAWALTLARITASSDIVFGHTISGRNTASIPGVETMVGPCVNIVPVRVRFEENWTVLELLRYIQDQQVANMPYEALGFRQIIKHCTDWPNWTNFSSVLQHNSASSHGELRLGENDYRVQGIGSDEDLADFSIMSTTLDRGKVGMVVSFPANGAVTESLAQRLLDMICDTAEGFTTHPSIELPTPATLTALPMQTVNEVEKISQEENFTSSQLKDLNRAEVLVLSDVLSRTWQQVLADKDENCPPFKPDTSFFKLGGDIVSLAQVAWLLEREDFSVRLDDLIEHPTMLGQMAVIVQSNSSTAKKMMASSQADAMVTSMTGRRSNASLRQKARKSSSWASAMSLARKMVRRESRNN